VVRPLWVATGLPDDRRAAITLGRPLRPRAELALAEQDSWTLGEHRCFWLALLPSWPRRDTARATRGRLRSLVAYLHDEKGLPKEAIRSVLIGDNGKRAELDTVTKYLRHGRERESEVTFPGSHDLPPWRLSRTDALEGARPLPRVATEEPREAPDPAFPFPDYYAAVTDSPPVPPSIRRAFVNAHEVAPHSAGLIGGVPVEHCAPGHPSEDRPSCPIGARLGIDGPRALGWRWEDDWLYSCLIWRAARERNARAPGS